MAEDKDYRSEEGQAWADHRERVRIAKKNSELDNATAVRNWCNQNNITYSIVAPYQYRVDIYGEKIDIYVGSKKYHNITKNVRGKIKGTISAFLTSLTTNK